MSSSQGGPRGPPGDTILFPRGSYLQSLTQMEREKIVWEFEQLYHSLKEQEYRLLARLEELDLAIYNSINGAITQFSCNISHLSGLISQLEEKQRQPTRELLQVRRTSPGLHGCGWPHSAPGVLDRSSGS